jgi:Asp-tRNA(Asn)/Glu-tRNA(Gln) amidotransferase A subunit family amidase
MLEELSAKVRSGEINPIDLVNESLRRIEAAKPLNAVVAVYADEARSLATSHPRTGALAGLPFLVKDMARVKGHVTTSGSMLYANGPADEVDDSVVSRLREAGAIIIGRSNSPEFGATAYTTNNVYGPTRNPWNTAMTPGGSSAGSGAAVASGMVPLALGSDGGGSVRIPSSFCGLFGMKASSSAVNSRPAARWVALALALAAVRLGVLC